MLALSRAATVVHSSSAVIVVPSFPSLLSVLLQTVQLVTPAGKTKSVPKRGCAFRLAFGGFVIDLAGKALESRRAGQKSRAEALSKGAGDRAAFPLQTLAL